ncbi:hypothetical protein BN1708_015980 [Verticillium longisporum]|uniref:Homeobox domain-containing protein n=1 Tax=Verticillium longisporum TaxID=100787 RepID=A0A0G4MBB7_VERLO|nr:hypothetical protein BN1708_015980 [Verticillium longisporum]
MNYFTNYPVYQYSSYNNGQYPSNTALQYQANAEAWRRHAMIQHGARTTETKPRLAKDEVDKLEREFQRNHKPNSSLKKQLAEEMRVDIARINNWFQNRRAKAKQEKRTQENEARRQSEQAADQPNQDVVKEYYPDDDHHDDLRPSAAPFPSMDSSASPEPTETADMPLDGPSESNIELDTDSTSPTSSTFQAPEQNYNDFSSSDGMFYPSQSPCDFSSISSVEMPEQQGPGPLTLSIPTHYASTAPESSTGSSYTGFQSMSSGVDMDDSMSAFASRYGSVNLDEAQARSADAMKYEHLSPDSAQSPMSGIPSLHFKSPPVDIASRRNTKRPAQLGTGCMRSFSYNQAGMKTGMEMPRRSELPSPMRRVASATGSLPRGIQKPVSATPRSPMYFDRNQENLLLQMAVRTPVATGPHCSAAPPTPNTPVIIDTQATREHTASSSASEEDKRYTFQGGLPSAQFHMDPTMRTPPDTPGLMSNFSGVMFPNTHLQTNFDYSGLSDEPLVTPGLGGFEAEFPVMPASLPSYVAPGCGSQPSTPSYPPANMGPAFFPSYQGGNAEYNWCDASLKASHDQSRSRNFQFTNMTAQDFHAE